MRTLRYLLISIAVLSAISISAQESTDSWGKLPEAKMQSTSVMQGSGSTLPQAAVTGTDIIEETQETAQKSGPRRERPGHWTDPYIPLGDALLPLALLALAYVGFVIIRKRQKNHLTK